MKLLIYFSIFLSIIIAILFLAEIKGEVKDMGSEILGICIVMGCSILGYSIIRSKEGF